MKTSNITTNTQVNIKNPIFASPNLSFQYSPLKSETISGVKEYLTDFLKSSLFIKDNLYINLKIGTFIIIKANIIIPLI